MTSSNHDESPPTAAHRRTRHTDHHGAAQAAARAEAAHDQAEATSQAVSLNATASAAQSTADDVESLRAALSERDERYLRLAADFENFRRRTAQELADRIRYGSVDAALALLPVLDNLQRAIDHASESSGESFLEGLRLVVRQFEEALASLGVSAIDAVGEPFDPKLHQAVTGEETPDVERDTVVEVLQRGYRLHDRLIRPAMVKVAHPAPPAREPTTAQDN